MAYPQQAPRARRPYAPRPPQPKAPPPDPVPKVKTVGPEDLWVTLQSVRQLASGASKRTAAMAVPGGVVINTCTRGAGYAAEALVFVPGVALQRHKTGLGTIVPAHA